MTEKEDYHSEELLDKISWPTNKFKLKEFMETLPRWTKFVGSKLSSSDEIIIDTSGRKSKCDFLVPFRSKGQEKKTKMKEHVLGPVESLRKANPKVAWEFNQAIGKVHSAEDPRIAWKEVEQSFTSAEDKQVYERVLHLIFWLFIEEDTNYWGPLKTKIYLGRTMLYGAIQRIMYGDSIGKVLKDWKLPL